jgi:purine nucleoside permease
MGWELEYAQEKPAMSMGAACTLWSLAGMARLHPGTQARTSAFVGRFAVVLVNSVDGRYDERGWTYDLGQSPP